MSDLVGMSQIGVLLKCGISAQGYVDSADFPEPVKSDPYRLWHRAEVERWAKRNYLKRPTLRSWAVQEGLLGDVPSEASRKGGLAPERWGKGVLMSTSDVQEALNLKNPWHFTRRVDFPKPALLEGRSRKWASEDILKYALEHKHSRALAFWVGAPHARPYGQGQFCETPPELISSLELSLLLGFPAQGFAASLHDPNFPEEVELGYYDKEDVRLWVEAFYCRDDYAYKLGDRDPEQVLDLL